MLSLLISCADDGVGVLSPLLLLVVVVVMLVVALVTLRKFESASIKVLIEGTGSKRGCTSHNITIFFNQFSFPF